MNDITINAENPIRKLEEKRILDVGTFQPHEVKESEEWSWKKMKSDLFN